MMRDQCSQAGVRPANMGRAIESKDTGREWCEWKRPYLPKRGKHCALSSHRTLSAKMPAQRSTSASHMPHLHTKEQKEILCFLPKMSLYLSRLNNRTNVPSLASHNNADHGDWNSVSTTEHGIKTWL